MIRYSLGCEKGHEFEGWFASSDDHDSQRERGLISCPACGSPHVSKLLMAPSVSTSRKKQQIARNAALASEHAGANAGHETGGGGSHDADRETGNPPGMSLTTPNDEQREIIARMRALKEELVSKAENVGERFSEEARKIHDGEAPARGIYGKATAGEAAELVEEGIEVLAIPEFPDERN